MAGDWIKMECATPDKAEVLSITAKMGWDDPDYTVGKLFRVWRWFDQHTTNGNADGVTLALLNRISGVNNFAEAMESVGWLIVTDAGISLPGFEKHCGKTAKERAQTAKRVASHKANAKGNGDGVSGALPREEKNRIKYKYSSDDLAVAELISEKVLPLTKSKKSPNLESWANDIRLMRESDKRTLNEIRSVFAWANQDQFWRANILSTSTLRKQFDKLVAKMGSVVVPISAKNW